MYEVMYEEEGLSVAEIADRLKCGTATLNRRMHAYRIAKRPRGGARRSADKKLLLFYLDQRLVCFTKNRVLSDLYDISYSMVYNYKRWKACGSLVGYNLTAVGRERTMEDIRV
jgi:hypothetical protein